MMVDGRHIENRFWLYLSALLADRREFGKEMKNHMPIQVT